MQTEQAIVRNFCPSCLEFTEDKRLLTCDKCNNSDLIPALEGYLVPEIKEENPELSKLKNQFSFLTGKAGSGKTFTINKIIEENPSEIKLGATTGIAAVNLGEKTINSLLKYFDTASLENAWREQLLHMNLRKIRARYSKLGIEECSMLGMTQFDFIINAIDEINSDNTGKKLGVCLVGDLCQLPPIKDKFIFESEYWKRFDENTIKLEKIWRQDNPTFIAAINLIRENKGEEAIPLLRESGVTFANELDNHTDATTLISNNFQVDSFNETRLRSLPGTVIKSIKQEYGLQTSEWKKYIPYELRVKIGAYVMILANDTPMFRYVNGDCGWIEDYKEEDGKQSFYIKLKRNNNVVKISRIERLNLSDKQPNMHRYTNFTPYSDFKTGDWVTGKILYHPLRLAYASTIHKSQGLSLDQVQIDCRTQFFHTPAMGYVSISRARMPEGLTLVGDPNKIGKAMIMDKKVLKYV